VIRPEDVDLLPEGQGSLEGVVTHMIFKGVHYEMEVMAGGAAVFIVSLDDIRKF
jgi:spermidine/putrescine transport system ATP-binding protein